MPGVTQPGSEKDGIGTQVYSWPLAFPGPSHLLAGAHPSHATKVVQAVHHTPAGAPFTQTQCEAPLGYSVAGLAMDIHWSAPSTLSPAWTNAQPQRDDHTGPSDPNATKSKYNSRMKKSSLPSWI